MQLKQWKSARANESHVLRMLTMSIVRIRPGKKATVYIAVLTRMYAYGDLYEYEKVNIFLAYFVFYFLHKCNSCSSILFTVFLI